MDLRINKNGISINGVVMGDDEIFGNEELCSKLGAYSSVGEEYDDKEGGNIINEIIKNTYDILYSEINDIYDIKPLLRNNLYETELNILNMRVGIDEYILYAIEKINVYTSLSEVYGECYLRYKLFSMYASVIYYKLLWCGYSISEIEDMLNDEIRKE